MPILNYVVENIGKYWRSMSLHLGVHAAILDNIEETCQTIPHRALAVLNEWCLRDPEKSTKGVLMKALRQIPRNDIADNISMMEWQNKLYIDGLVQERRNPSALATELRLSCTYPSICGIRSPFSMYCVMWEKAEWIGNGISHLWFLVNSHNLKKLPMWLRYFRRGILSLYGLAVT